ncbi:MAG: cytochrome ubiquinol oxidase subunit I [Nitrospiraceae bacterium]
MWFVTQQHTYFGGFVLALPIFSVLLEFLGLMARNPALSLRYDGLARDLLKVALLSLSVTAVVGSLMLGMFITLYPSFMQYMGSTFKVMMPLYALVFVGTTLLTIVYYYTWNRLSAPGLKYGHATIGLLSVVFGTSLLLLANAWAAFMMSPAGVDAEGRYLGNPWHLLHSALWNPLNVHRFLADIMSGGAVVLAYACYRFFTGKNQEERAYYDWVGYIFLFVTVCALLPMPFAGYWLMRSVYAFRQSMGVTMMGAFDLAVRGPGVVDRGVVLGGELLSLAKHGAHPWWRTLPVLLPVPVIGPAWVPVHLADAPYVVDERQRSKGHGRCAASSHRQLWRHVIEERRSQRHDLYHDVELYPVPSRQSNHDYFLGQAGQCGARCPLRPWHRAYCVVVDLRFLLAG